MIFKKLKHLTCSIFDTLLSCIFERWLSISKLWREYIWNRDTWYWILGVFSLSLTVFTSYTLLIEWFSELCFEWCKEDLSRYGFLIEKLEFWDKFTAFFLNDNKILLVILLLFTIGSCYRFGGLSTLAGRIKLPHLCFFSFLNLVGILVIIISQNYKPNTTSVLKITLFPAIIGFFAIAVDVFAKREEYWTDKRRMDLADVFHKLKKHIVIFGHGDFGHLVCREIFQQFLNQGDSPFRDIKRRYKREEDSQWERVCFNFVVVEKNKDAVPFLIGEVPGLGVIGYIRVPIWRHIKEGYIQSLIATNIIEKDFKKREYLIPVLVADERNQDTWEKLKIDNAELVISNTYSRQAESDLLKWVAKKRKKLLRPAIIIGCETRRWREYLKERWTAEYQRFEAFHVFEFIAEVMSAASRLTPEVRNREECKILITGQYHKMSLIYYFINALIEGRNERGLIDPKNILLIDEMISTYCDEWLDNSFFKIMKWKASKGLVQLVFKMRADGKEFQYRDEPVEIQALKEPVMRYLPIVLRDWKPHLVVMMDRTPGDIIQHLTQIKEYMQHNIDSKSTMPALLVVAPTAELRKEATRLTIQHFGQIYGFVSPFAGAAREMATMGRYLVGIGRG